MKRAVFLDRDGTLIQERGYICSFQQVEIFPFAAEALRRLRAKGICAVMVTNQSAVARGICSLEEVETLHNQLQSALAADSAFLDALYYCPFHPRGKVVEFAKDSPWRKPAPGMLLQASADLNLDLSQSLMVGDKLSDLAAGKAAGCRTALVRTGCGCKTENELLEYGLSADMVADNLLQAVTIWLDGVEG